MPDATQPSPEASTTSNARLRLAIAALALSLVGALAVIQGVLLLGAAAGGDAAGSGMDRALRNLAAAAAVPIQLGLVGLAVGLLVPKGGARRVAWLAGLGALAAWSGTAICVGALGATGTLEAVPYASELFGVVWVTGFLAVGLSLGASRQVGSVLTALLPLPLSIVAPLALYLLTD